MALDENDGRNPFVNRDRGTPGEIILPGVGQPRNDDEAQLLDKTRLAALHELSIAGRSAFAQQQAQRLSSTGFERFLDFEEGAADLEARISRLPEDAQRRIRYLHAALSQDLGEHIVRTNEAAAYGMAEHATRPIEIEHPKSPGFFDRLMGE